MNRSDRINFMETSFMESIQSITPPLGFMFNLRIRKNINPEDYFLDILDTDKLSFDRNTNKLVSENNNQHIHIFKNNYGIWKWQLTCRNKNIIISRENLENMKIKGYDKGHSDSNTIGNFYFTINETLFKEITDLLSDCVDSHDDAITEIARSESNRKTLKRDRDDLEFRTFSGKKRTPYKHHIDTTGKVLASEELPILDTIQESELPVLDLNQEFDEANTELPHHSGLKKVEGLPEAPDGWEYHFSNTFKQWYLWNLSTNATRWPEIIQTASGKKKKKRQTKKRKPFKKKRQTKKRKSSKKKKKSKSKSKSKSK